MNKATFLLAILIGVGILTGCSSAEDETSSGNSGDGSGELIHASSDSADILFQQPLSLDVLANDSSKRDAELTLVAAGPAPEQQLQGAVAIIDGQLHYTPAADFVGVEEIWYQVSDGTEQVSAKVTLTLLDSLQLSGTVSPANLATAGSASVEVSSIIDGRRFSSYADAQGNYQLSIGYLPSTADANDGGMPHELATTQIVEVVASFATDQQAGQTLQLASGLAPISELFQQAVTGKVTLADSAASITGATLNQELLPGLAITPLSTALSMQVKQYYQASDFSSSYTLQQLTNALNNSDITQLSELAGLIYLLCTHPDYPLPPEYSSWYMYFTDSEALTEVLTQAKQYNDFGPALTASLMTAPTIPMDKINHLADTYVRMASSQDEGFDFNGFYYFIDEHQRLTYFPTDGWFADWTSNGWTLRYAGFDVSRTIANFINDHAHQYDPALFDLFVQSVASLDPQTPLEDIDDDRVEIRPVSYQNGHIYAVFEVLSEFKPIPFTYQGVSYELPRLTVNPPTTYIEHGVATAMFASARTFDISEGSQFVIPGVFWEYNNNEDPLADAGELLYSPLLATFHPQTEFAGSFTRRHLDSGTYQLNADKTILSLQFDDPSVSAVSYQLRYISDDPSLPKVFITETQQLADGTIWQPTVDVYWPAVQNLDSVAALQGKLLFKHTFLVTDEDGNIAPLEQQASFLEVYLLGADNHAPSISVMCAEATDDLTCTKAELVPSDMGDTWHSYQDPELPELQPRVLFNGDCVNGRCGGGLWQVVGVSPERQLVAVYLHDESPAGTEAYGPAVRPFGTRVNDSFGLHLFKYVDPAEYGL
ncbi:Ig-like domain-containing protein [Pseudidiomarina sp. WS423]|uniref:Ig-like domain-containing protein n=1 Tax=Pseudidiomarina sp. WS423 TaxID=3425124 RepID=UPI003D6FEDA9